MKVIHFIHPETGESTYGYLKDEYVEICRGKTLWKLSETNEIIKLSEITRYLPPLFPPNILALGLNYHAHAREGGQPIPKEPIIFLKSTTSVIGHKDDIILPKTAPNEVDYEGELAVVIGKKAKNITKGKALDHVLGYTCGNDVSARDCQLKKDVQWARGKSFDTFCPLGPWMETDLNLQTTRIQTRVNGQLLQDSVLSDMIFSVEDLVSFISHSMTLLPGTIILTGTPGGVGFARDPPLYLKDGDFIQVTIDEIGNLENTVITEV